MAARSSLRIGDAEREASAASLREHYAQGRLSLEEFNQRLDAVFSATTQGQLDQITGDLPHVRTPVVPLPVSDTGGGRSHGGRRGSGPGARFRAFAVLLAGLAAAFVLWAVVLAPGLWHFRLFHLLSGRFSILLGGIFIIRLLLRWVFGRRGGRRGRFAGPGANGRYGRGGPFGGGGPFSGGRGRFGNGGGPFGGGQPW